MDKETNTSFLWMISLTAACGGLLFGYDWVVIGGAKPFYEAYFNVTEAALSGWIMGSALVGCMVGAIMAGALSDRYGRKYPLILAAFLFVISALGTAAAWDLTSFVLFRILGGVGIGLASTLSPLYIAEISPAHSRGKMVTLNQLTIVLGVLAAQFINLMIAETVPAESLSTDILASWNGQLGWRYMFAAELVPAVLFFLFMFLVPESPRWLCKMGRKEEALHVLNKIGSKEYAQASLDEITTSLPKEKVKGSLKQQFVDLKKKPTNQILLVGVVLAIFQQWCGINVIFNYAQDIFKSAGFDINDTLKSIVATGLVNLLFTILALPLVDKIGRRRLMIFGSSALACLYGLIALAYGMEMLGRPVLILLLCAIAVYALTLAPVTWVLLSEIFPNAIRGTAMAICVLALWAACFVLTVTFPLLNEALGAAGCFIVYGFICAFGALFIYRKVPETKSLSLEEVEKLFKGSV